MTTTLIISLPILIAAGSLAWLWLSLRSKKLSAQSEEPYVVIHSGKDPSWHAPVFEASIASPFFIKPWLQAGDAPTFADPAVGESLEILWHTVDDSRAFHVEVAPAGTAKDGLAPDPQRPVFIPERRDIQFTGVVAQVQYKAKLTGLKPGEQFDYVVYADNVPVYHATARARPAQGKPFKALVFGDMGNGSKWQKLIAYQMSLNNKHGADVVLSLGDVVYQHGRYSEYLSKFFPVYQPAKDGPEYGATLFDNTVVFGCGGNHCFAWLDPDKLISFDQYPDLMAYFALWSMPLNGPDLATLGKNIPPMIGQSSAIKNVLDAAGERYPRMANFSYDYGVAHFLILDANPYMDWTDEKLRLWVEDDLKAVAPGQWKIVAFHQPGFTSNINHQSEQRMRFLADIFERQGVDMVFNGHAHMYDRSRPLKFKVAGGIKPSAMDKLGYVPGEFVYDTTFDGVTNTVPDGVIYVVTGGGGAKLDSKELHSDPSQWLPSTAKLLGDRHSFTVVEFDPAYLRLTQIDYEGKVFDEITITKKPDGSAS